MSQGVSDIKEYVLRAQCMEASSEVEALVKEVLHIDHIFSFGELLLVPTVQQLRDSKHSVALSTLELYAYGTLRDYTSSPDNYFVLSDSQLLRLKLLTLVSLAYQHKQLDYGTLHKELDTQSSRELEDLVIEAVYHGLLTAKIDQKNERLRILSCSGRDITPADLSSMLESMSNWRSNCVKLMESIQSSSAHISGQRTAAAEESKCLHADINRGLKEILTRDGAVTVKGSGSSGSGGIFGSSSLLNRARPKRSRGHQSRDAER